MKPVHIALAFGLTIVWGLNFVAIRIGLDAYPPLLFAALRFLVAAVPVLFVARPNIAFMRLVAIAATLFVGQFALLFWGIVVGFPAGLASLTLQIHAFFTILIAAAALGERPLIRNSIALGIAFLGLIVIASTAGSNGVTLAGFAFIMASALSWATGNVILRATGKIDMFPLVVWTSLLAVPPLLGLSLIFEGLSVDFAALAHPSISGLGALAYNAIPTTILGYWIWSDLFKHYPAAKVVPFSLLVPVTGTLSASFILGESFGPVRLAGMALIMAGLAVNTLPLERWWRRAISQ